MQNQSDSLGEAITAYYSGQRKAAITVISSIAEDDVIPVAYLFRDYENMPELEQMALESCQGKVLDIGAGAGSHALWLQKKGMDVTALEISGKAAEVMRMRGIKNV